jgi:hypothetical protein
MTDLILNRKLKINYILSAVKIISLEILTIRKNDGIT